MLSVTQTTMQRVVLWCVNIELDEMCKRHSHWYCKALFRSLPGGTEKIHENPQWEHLFSWPRYEPRISRKWLRSSNRAYKPLLWDGTRMWAHLNTATFKWMILRRTEKVDWVGNASDLYSGGARFDSRLGYRLSWLPVFMFFPVPAGTC
jgi:hypothetical protein